MLNGLLNKTFDLIFPGHVSLNEECFTTRRRDLVNAAHPYLDLADPELELPAADVVILAAAVAEHPQSTAAACVVLDVDTREILALVSVPTFDPHAMGADYTDLRDDARRRPLLFRAVSEEYQPGSIPAWSNIKPIPRVINMDGTIRLATLR